jgi:hypothetical protein
LSGADLAHVNFTRCNVALSLMHNVRNIQTATLAGVVGMPQGVSLLCHYRCERPGVHLRVHPTSEFYNNNAQNARYGSAYMRALCDEHQNNAVAH